ncbi:tyrosine-type recombinase/integrase [Streptomyces sp. NPDC007025]|uniref:tyrosine-type recombinase/integrase n=1 Tax=Streptomyces sp. NPDC007025 TaxID=3364771 RepID=UPI0036BBBDDE
MHAAPDTRLGIRDCAIASVHFGITGREHEVAALRQRHITDHPQGLVVDVRVSKVKPRLVVLKYGSRLSTCPVRNLKAWREIRGWDDPDDFLFKPLHPRWHTVLDGGLSPEAIGDVITRLGARAKLPYRPTGHSPRREAATSSHRAGNDRKVIAKQGGWSDNSTALESYFEIDDGWENNAMNGVL